MSWKQLTAAAALGIALATAPPATAQNAEGVAAIVNDSVISTFDVRQRAALILVSAGVQSTPEMLQRANAQALRDLIDERLQLQEAAEFDIDVTDEQVDRQIAEIARQNETNVEGLAERFRRDGISLSTLRSQIKAESAWRRLISGLYGSRVRISEVEVAATLQRIAANATRPQYQISEIFLPAETEQEFTEMEQGAMRLIEQMQRGAPFPLVARQFSQAPSAAAGGDIGWIAAPELPIELQAIAERLQQGQVSLPVRTPTGVYIIAMRNRRAGADAGATSVVALRQITAPVARQASLARLQRRIEGCNGLEEAVSDIQGATVIDLGETQESELSPAIRDRIRGIEQGAATPVTVSGEQVDTIVVCGRQTGGGGVPPRQEVEDRLREQELALLAERYLRNLRREATIITR
ncbi:MAG: peptidylprolyl isomerase [Hyphomonadaceae bacterium]|nr:peptidylprolyl isomerase [Hyphomonadaceae bacterium]